MNQTTMLFVAIALAIAVLTAGLFGMLSGA